MTVGIGAILGAAAGVEGERVPSIRALMHKQYTVSNAPFDRIEEELEAEAPDWAKVREASKTFLDLAATLEKNTPRRGDEASWKRFTGRQYGDAKAMVDAAEARDEGAILAAHRRLAKACQACHDAHKFRARD